VRSIKGTKPAKSRKLLTGHTLLAFQEPEIESEESDRSDDDELMLDEEERGMVDELRWRE